MTMRPVRTYLVAVTGYDGALYSARSRSKARALAWQSFHECFDVSFRDFVVRTSVHRVDDPPGVGGRIMVAGKPGVRIIGGSSHRVAFMWDGSDVPGVAHPSEVQAIP